MHTETLVRATTRRGATALVPALVAAATAVALCLAAVPAVGADRNAADRDAADTAGVGQAGAGGPGRAESGQAYPSRRQVAAARRRATEKEREVGAIKAAMALADQRLHAASVRAEIAAEAYNAAVWRLQQARAEALRAAERARRARTAVHQQRRAIARLVAASYQHNDQLSALDAMMSAEGPEGVLDSFAAFQGATDSVQADYDRFAAAEALARSFEREARRARKRQEVLVGRARTAADQAAAAAAATEATANQIAAEKERLLGELAAAQGISVRLARERQSALEEIARRRAAERARAEAEAAAKAEARAEAKRRAEAAAAEQEESRRDKSRPKGSEPGPDRNPAPRPRPDPAPRPSPPPPAPDPPPPPAPEPPRPGGGVERAIAYATAQLGEPYQWGATGPRSWDCSGLMLRAWQSAGAYLPRVSRDQYRASTPITLGQLRRGDLLFWGTSSDPGSIHHVAMYLGDGLMIHAPRTGRDVSIESMYYWIPPNFFGRV